MFLMILWSSRWKVEECEECEEECEEECDMVICWRGSELNDVHCGFISDI